MEPILHSTGGDPTCCRSLVVAALAVLLTVGVVQAAENVNDRTHAPRRIVIIDSGLLYPGTLTIHQGEPLEFQNYSSEFVILTFVEPRNAGDELRCGLTDNGDSNAGMGNMARWSVSTDGPDHGLAVMIPPGRFSSTCSLAAGQYVFVTKRIARDNRSSTDTLGLEGTITVQ